MNKKFVERTFYVLITCLIFPIIVSICTYYIYRYLDNRDKSPNITVKDNHSPNASVKGDKIPYITFKCDQTQVFKMTGRPIESMEYSVNGGDWKELGVEEITFGGNTGDLRLRSQNHEGTAKKMENNSYSYSKIIFSNQAEVFASGDIRTIIDYQNYNKVDTKEARFVSLFSGCTQLVSAPDLPATNLAGYCYSKMFEGCTSLVKAPELPATTLTEQCYFEMFANCTSLTEAPKLPATTLAKWCYWAMFAGCTSLTEAPKILATNLNTSNSGNMFKGCPFEELVNIQ